MSRRGWGVLGLVTASLAVIGVLVFAAADRPRNFHVVREGALYRSGQLSPAALERVIETHRIRTVVTLRPLRDAEAKSDAWEEEACRARGIRHVRIPLTQAEDGSEPLEPVSHAFLAVMDDPANHPVLVHCLAGRDRTGVACAVYRIEYDRWPPERAVDEMRVGGFDPDKDAAAAAYANFVRGYRPRWHTPAP